MNPDSHKCIAGIIIVTYNSAEDIDPCLQAVCDSKGVGETVIAVVDNASSDGTADVVAREFPDVRLIRNETNVYYANACNQGARAAGSGAKYLLLLNPDVCLREDTLNLLTGCLEQNADIAAVAPKLVWPDGKVQRSVRRFPTYSTLWCELLGLSRLLPNHPGFSRWRINLDNVRDAVDVDQPMASCLLIRRAVWDTIGGFDERFPMFFNDVDLCCRIKQSEWRIVYLPQAMATHRLGGSVRPVMAKMVWFSHLGFLRFLRKHHRQPAGLVKYMLSMPIVILAAVLRSVYWLIRGRV